MTMTKLSGNDAGMREAAQALLDEYEQVISWRDPNRHESAAGHPVVVAMKAALSPPTGSAGDNDAGMREDGAGRKTADVGVFGPIDGMDNLDRSGSYIGLSIASKSSAYGFRISMGAAEVLLAELAGLLGDFSAALAPKTSVPGIDAGVREALAKAIHDAIADYTPSSLWPMFSFDDARGVWWQRADIFLASPRGRALAAQPPKAETPAGVACEAVEAASAAFYNTMIGPEREFFPHHEGWAGKDKAFKAKVRGRMRTALEAALSHAPAARAGDGVERYKAGAMDMRDAAANAISAAGSRLLRDKGDALCVAVLGDAARMVRALPLTAAPATNKDGA